MIKVGLVQQKIRGGDSKLRAIMVMYDSLNRGYLEPYSNETGTLTPNFSRLAERSVRFNQCYVGSLPCMPARRELQTGRYNFLHTPWGYMEPYDESMPKILAEHGCHSHLISDHYHYWEDEGANYHCHYRTWEAVRGQEGDPWKGIVDEPGTCTANKGSNPVKRRQDMLNREMWVEDDDMRPMKRTFTKGMEFLQRNWQKDNWFLNIETFDPHEPFDAPRHHKVKYPDDYEGPILDWDSYSEVTETDSEVSHIRNSYRALVSYCDEQLGLVLDFMDANKMWDDTMLIVCTDHGHFLSERGYWGKNYVPNYREIANTPLFIWDPRSTVAGEVRESLVQTIDITATVMDYFELSHEMKHMQGYSLAGVIRDDTPVRESGLFGYFGSMTCLIHDNAVLMKAAASEENQPLFNHTWHLFRREKERCNPTGDFGYSHFDFCDGMPLPKVPILEFLRGRLQSGDMLFDLNVDPEQNQEIDDPELHSKMCKEMVRLMKASEAPEEQYVRLGLTAFV